MRPRLTLLDGLGQFRGWRVQLAVPAADPPDGPEWLHEVKYDGMRMGIVVRGGRATLHSRRGIARTTSFPEIAEAAESLGHDCIIDGELCVLDAQGRPDFALLQNIATSRSGLVYFAFDLQALDGHSLQKIPLLQRKDLLHRLVHKGVGRLRYADHIQGNGPAVFSASCKMGLEGIVSKRADAHFHAGRVSTWLKVKCGLRQEFVIGGFTEPEGGRRGLGSVLVGYYEKGALHFAGRVGTGFTNESALALRRKLDRIETSTSPFTPAPTVIARTVHWTRPSLVCEVAFQQWTHTGHIRAPAFKGLRTDKAARAVRRERIR